jgi:primosomal protein N'
VQRAVSPVRFFDPGLLELARWISARYVTPLAEVLGALAPPRVASEEGAMPTPPSRRSPVDDDGGAVTNWRTYTNGAALAGAIATGRGGAFVVRASRRAGARW